MKTYCEICHHTGSRGFDAEMGKCECACHRVADAAPALLAACKAVLVLIEGLEASDESLCDFYENRVAEELERLHAAIALAEKTKE